MTALGVYLSKKSVNRSDVARKTGISKTRLSELANNSKTQLRVDELYIIAKAIAATENSQSFVVNIFKKTPLYPRLSNQSQSV